MLISDFTLNLKFYVLFSHFQFFSNWHFKNEFNYITPHKSYKYTCSNLYNYESTIMLVCTPTAVLFYIL